MLDQTFSLLDVPKIFTLFFLEGILSIDNALAIAIIVKPLAKEKQLKALFIGIISSIILRGAGILSASYLIQLFFIQIIGGFYLLYLSITHLKVKKKSEKIKVTSFLKTVLLIEMTDFIFAIDSILAGLAFIDTHARFPKLPPKIWIVYVGGILGIVFMRFCTKFFVILIEKFKRLEIAAHLIIGWVAIKLLLEGSLKYLTQESFVELPPWMQIIFWLGIVSSFAFGFTLKKSRGK